MNTLKQHDSIERTSGSFRELLKRPIARVAMLTSPSRRVRELHVDVQDILEKFPGRVEADLTRRRRNGESVTLLFAGPVGPDLHDLYRLPSDSAHPMVRAIDEIATKQHKEWMQQWGISENDIPV